MDYTPKTRVFNTILYIQGSDYITNMSNNEATSISGVTTTWTSLSGRENAPIIISSVFESLIQMAVEEGFRRQKRNQFPNLAIEALANLANVKVFLKEGLERKSTHSFRSGGMYIRRPQKFRIVDPFPPCQHLI